MAARFSRRRLKERWIIVSVKTLLQKLMGASAGPRHSIESPTNNTNGRHKMTTAEHLNDRLEQSAINKDSTLTPPEKRQKPLQSPKSQKFLEGPASGGAENSGLSSQIRKLCLEESRRGRPLVVVHEKSGRKPYAKNERLTLGTDYLSLLAKSSAPRGQYFDMMSIYSAPVGRLSVFYGENNAKRVSVGFKDLAEHDPDGTLINAILGVNAPGTQGVEEAEGIGFIAACMNVGYIKAPSPSAAKEFLKALPLDVSREALRHALVYLSRYGSDRLIEALLEMGADPNVSSDDDGSVPLEIAMQSRRFKLATMLVEHGADPTLKLSSGATCRGLAQRDGVTDFIELFAKPSTTRT